MSASRTTAFQDSVFAICSYEKTVSNDRSYDHPVRKVYQNFLFAIVTASTQH